MSALIFITAIVAVISLTIWFGRTLLLKRAHTLSYAGLREYLYAIPQTPTQQHDAVELALKGLVITSLGILFGPLLLVGLPPLYFGLRKILLMRADHGQSG